MSFSAVSVKHFAILAHLPVVSLPKNPSNSIYMVSKSMIINYLLQILSLFIKI